MARARRARGRQRARPRYSRVSAPRVWLAARIPGVVNEIGLLRRRRRPQLQQHPRRRALYPAHLAFSVDLHLSWSPMLPYLLSAVAFWGSVLGGGFYFARRYVRAFEAR